MSANRSDHVRILNGGAYGNGKPIESMKGKPFPQSEKDF